MTDLMLDQFGDTSQKELKAILEEERKKMFCPDSPGTEEPMQQEWAVRCEISRLSWLEVLLQFLIKMLPKGGSISRALNTNK